MALPDLVIGVKNLSEAVAQIWRGNARNADGRVGGAGEPMAPSMAPGTEPRGAVLPNAYNIGARPRAGTGTTLTAFEQLRFLADFDLIRAAINDVKNQILGMDWEIRVRPEFKGQEQALSGRIDEVRTFLQYPDMLAGIAWPQWLGSVVEEILVTDALTLLPRRDLGGRLIGLEQIDGATIIPLVDDRGRPALPPHPAYQQIVRGIIETEFLQGEILYLPRNVRANSPYGRSNVEGVIFTANLAIRQQLYELEFYTSGNLPDGGFWTVHESWTADDLERTQKKLDEIAAGRSDKRSGYVKLMPPGEYVDTKERQWDYEFMEWLGRIIAWNFGVSPIPFAKQMNRSTGETLEQSSMEAGPRPIADFVAHVINRALTLHGGITEVEFAWQDDETEDPTVVYQRADVQRKGGIITINDARQAAGMEPYPFETPAMIDTPSGPQLLEKLIEDLQNPPEPSPLPPPIDQPKGQEGAPPADIPAADDDEPTAQEKAWAAAFTKYRAAVVTDIRKWKGVVAKRAREGKAPRAFKSSVLTPRMRWALDVAEVAAFDQHLPLFKGELKPTKARSKVEKAIVALVGGWLAELEPKAIAWAMEQLPADKVAKADGLNWSAGDLADGFLEQLTAGGTVGASEAGLAMGINLERVPPEVITYARRRAGELVGKQYVGGVWVDSTTGFAISDTLRDQVKGAVSRAIEEKWTPQELSSTLKGYFEISRAQTIARTETAFAYGNGAAELYKAEGVELLNVKDGPGCLPYGHDDTAPEPDDAPGTVQASAQAEGQTWTVGEYQGAVIGHPNCVRVATPYFAK